jgi:hypothetical protein
MFTLSASSVSLPTFPWLAAVRKSRSVLCRNWSAANQIGTAIAKKTSTAAITGSRATLAVLIRLGTVECYKKRFLATRS